MADLLYELLSQTLKHTNITINLTAKPESKDAEEAAPSGSASVGAEPQPPQESGLVRADLVQLITDLESVSATLKRINKSLAGHDDHEVFFMLQNFDKILTSIKMVVNAV